MLAVRPFESSDTEACRQLWEDLTEWHREIFASPEILIGAASQRTRYLRLGSGVVNLPMHHPFHVADRMVMLDHLTHGRVMLGVGSGARWADFRMLGYDPAVFSKIGLPSRTVPECKKY